MTMPSEKGDPASQRRESILFYTTAFFVLLAMFSLFAFLFLVPFFIEPALATLYMDFDPTPVTCETVEANFLRGLSNCNWSSCREGCTKEVFECWHIRVRYRSPVPPPVSAAPAGGSPTPPSASSAVPKDPDLKSLHYNTRLPGQSQSSDRLQSVLPGPDESQPVLGRLLADDSVKLYEHRARLQPNVKGCGYPPDVECNASFAPTYGVVGNNFSCYYSTVDPSLAITHLNIEQVRAELIYCLTIPVFLFVVSVVYLFYAYFKIYADEPPATATVANSPSGGMSASASAHASASLAGRSPSNYEYSGQPGARKSRSDLAVEDVVIERPTSPSASMAGKFRDFDDPQSSYDAHHRHRGQRIVRRAKSGGTIGSPVATSSTARAPAGAGSRADYGTSKTPAAAAAGMRLSKSMGPRVGECCVAATAERRPACSYLSRSSSTCSTTSSASSSSSSSCSSASSRSSSSSSSSVTSSPASSPSHVPESLSSSRCSLASGASGHSDSLALTSAAAAAAEASSAAAQPISTTINDQAAAQQLNQPSPSTARRRPRECVPLISKS